VIPAVESGQKLEVSTGLVLDAVAPGGAFRGRTYNATARNVRPDHLALLPGGRGACACDDGCGLLANAGEPTEALRLPETFAVNSEPVSSYERTFAAGGLGLPVLNFDDSREPEPVGVGPSPVDGLPLPSTW
jgi:hypothetical protein